LFQESAVSVLVEEHCLHLLPSQRSFPLPLTAYVEQPCPPRMLAIYADLARNNAFDKGIGAGCVLPRIAAGQLAMEVCQGTQVAPIFPMFTVKQFWRMVP
jgi:hypothetical protein